MNYYFISDNLVAKIESHEDESTITDGHLYQFVFDENYFSRLPNVGWVFDGAECYPNIPDVTPRQIRQALILSGISMSMIDTALGGLPEPTRSLAIAEWEYSNSFSRRRDLVESVGQMLGWNADQLDSLWLLAGSIL